MLEKEFQTKCQTERHKVFVVVSVIITTSFLRDSKKRVKLVNLYHNVAQSRNVYFVCVLDYLSVHSFLGKDPIILWWKRRPQRKIIFVFFAEMYYHKFAYLFGKYERIPLVESSNSCSL